MVSKIKVAILDDHQSIIDGYQFRLVKASNIHIVGTALTGHELEAILAHESVDVLLLDVSTPTEEKGANSYPILHKIAKFQEICPHMHILAISMHSQKSLIKAIVEAGACGYILKDDRDSIRNLEAIITSVAQGGNYFSSRALQQLMANGREHIPLSTRQLEVLSLCAAYPDESTAELAKRLNVADSTVRNLLSNTYLKLNVHSRTAAVAKIVQLGIIPPLEEPTLE